jgi:hypothetical protein
MTNTQSTFTLSEIFELISCSLILLQDKQITIVESNLKNEEEPDIKQRIGLVDYIVRAIGNQLLERYGETEESIKKALENTKIDFDSLAYPKESKGVAIYNDIY